MADEQYFYHILITPFLLGISSQMPNIAGFFGIFLFLYFQGIFSDLPVFSHVFSCNIGKGVGKESRFTNGVSQASATRSNSACASSNCT